MMTAMNTREAPPRACPQCGSTDAVRIVYGYPTVELFEAEQRGEGSLGGCVVGNEIAGLRVPQLRRCSPLARA
jgi:hypothetical protein